MRYCDETPMRLAAELTALKLYRTIQRVDIDSSR